MKIKNNFFEKSSVYNHKNNKNFSKTHEKYVKKLKIDKIFVLFSQIFILILFLGLWELLTQLNVLDSFFVSSPSRIIKQLQIMIKSETLWTHTFVTFYETVIGFCLATGIGWIVAVILWWNEKVRKILEPYIIILNALPKIALGPIIILWVGSGTNAIIMMCILICVVITTMSLLSSFLSVDEGKILLLKSMNANKFQIFFKLILPNSIPDLMSVLKINVGMSWVRTIMGEYLSSKAGLGYLIVYGGQIFKIDLVMTSTFILCLLAGSMYFIISLFEKRYKK